jgi:hypothetical protein
MSKSERRPGHAIYLLDSPDVIRAKVLRAVTDSQHWIRFDENGPGMYNLLTIYELFSGLHRPDIEARFAGKGYSDFKRELAEVIIAGLRPVHSRHRALMAEATHIDALLACPCSSTCSPMGAIFSSMALRRGGMPYGEVVMREYGFTVDNVCLQALALLPRTRDRKVG